MHIHTLQQVADPPLDEARWTIEWDANRLSLKDPKGMPVIHGPTTTMHRIIDLERLALERGLTFKSPMGLYFFKPSMDAAADVQAQVRNNLQNDPTCLAEVLRPAWRRFWIAAAIFIVSISLFAAYCWWAYTSNAAPPPPWLKAVGPFVHFGLAVLMALSIAGPVACWQWMRHILRTRRVFQRILDGQGTQWRAL